MEAFDIARARSDTPGCEHVTHFNNAGAALMPQQVLQATTQYLTLEATIGGYEAAEASHEIVEAVYDSIGRLIGCERDEVAVVENATRAWDMAFYAIPFAPGDRILTSAAEYGSNYLAMLQVAGRTGASIEVVPDDEHGQISLAALNAMIDDDVKLIALTHVPTNSGLVNPAAEVGAIARRANILYLLDATQSVGQLPVDVGTIGCDILAATGRKYLRAPRGTGFLYVRREVIERLEPPFIDVHAAVWTALDRYELRPDARRFENWETNYAGKVGLGAAVDYALDWGVEATWARISELSAMFRRSLSAIPHVTVRDPGEQRCGIITFTVDGQAAANIRSRLSKQRINVSVTRAQYSRLDMERRGLTSAVRASLHYYNTEAEIERLCDALAAISAD